MKPIEETHLSLAKDYPKINEQTYDNANYSAREVQEHTVDKQVLKELFDETKATLEDMKGIGVPPGTNYTAIDAEIQLICEFQKALGLDK